MIYVASSWRNPLHTAVCAALQSTGLEHYNFKDEAAGAGFHWSEISETYRRPAPGTPEQLMGVDEYIEVLKHPLAEKGFASDFDAMQACDTFVLVLPCGRSAHLELGWAIGQGKRTAIMLDGPTVTPELMYKMADYLAPDLFSLLGWLGVED